MLVFLNISTRDLNASLCAFPIFTSDFPGDGLCGANIKSYETQTVASMEDICGMLDFFGKNSAVFYILVALALGVYALCNL